MPISFNNQSISFNLKKKSTLKQWIKCVVEKERYSIGRINYIFCSDEELLKINAEYLNHTTYTDIITFDYTEVKKISGDVFISIERVKENAEKFKIDFETELHRVLIHGVLHLCGYKDKSKSDKIIMRKKEDAALKLNIAKHI